METATTQFSSSALNNHVAALCGLEGGTSSICGDRNTRTIEVSGSESVERVTCQKRYLVRFSLWHRQPVKIIPNSLLSTVNTFTLY